MFSRVNFFSSIFISLERETKIRDKYFIIILFFIKMTDVCVVDFYELHELNLQKLTVKNQKKR